MERQTAAMITDTKLINTHLFIFCLDTTAVVVTRTQFTPLSIICRSVVGASHPIDYTLKQVKKLQT